MTNSTPPKSAPAVSVEKQLPPKPYTEYTIFFRLERTHLLQSSGIIDEEVLASLDPCHYDPVEFPRPARYARLALPPYWYSASHKAAVEKRRKHRKRAGRMDLKTLSKTISARWRKAREADPEAVEYCKRLARIEAEKYDEMVDPRNGAGGRPQQPSNAEAVAEVASSPRVGGPSLQDFVLANVNRPQAVDSTMRQPVMAYPPVGSSGIHMENIDRLRASFNEVMGYGNNGSNGGPQFQREERMLLQMLGLQAMRQQFEAAQQRNVTISEASPTSVPSLASSSANNKNKRKLTNGNVQLQAQPQMDLNAPLPSTFDLVGGLGDDDADAFAGNGNPAGPKKPRSEILRRVSMEPMEHDDRAFEWERRDADALLDMLDAPRDGRPIDAFDDDNEMATLLGVLDAERRCQPAGSNWEPITVGQKRTSAFDEKRPVQAFEMLDSIVS